MLSKASRIAFGLVAAVLAGLAVCAVGLVGLFWSGPVSIGFLTPYFERIVAQGDAPFRISVDDTILTWAGWDRGIDVRAVNVRFTTPAGVTVAEMPEVAVTLSTGAMAEGVIAPRRIDVFGPEVFVRRAADGGFALSFGPANLSERDAAPDTATGNLTDRLFAMLSRAPDPDNPLSYLDSVAIVGGAVSLFDERTGRGWYAPVANGTVRRGETGVGFDGSLTADLAGSETDIEIVGAVIAATGDIQIGGRFQDLVPAALAEFDPAVAALAAANVPLSGKASATLAADGTVTVAQAEFEADRGTVVLPDADKTEIVIQSASGRVRYDRAQDRIGVDALEVGFGAEGTQRIAAIDHTFPIRTLRLAGSYAPRAGQAEVRSLTIDLGGPAVSATANVEGIGSEAMTVVARVEGGGVPVDDLATFWPVSLGSDAHDWSIHHLSGGTIRTATVDAALVQTAGGGFEATRVDGTMRVEDVTVAYLDGMPPVTGVSGDMTFNASRFDITVESGQSVGLNVNGGTIALTDLDTDTEKAEIRLDITGSARDAVTLIDNPTLSFASAVGVSADRVGGAAGIDFRIKFLLKKDLTWDEIQVKARAALAGLGVRRAALGLDLRDAEADLVVDNDGLDFKADGILGRLPIRVSWRENFSQPRAFKSRYDVQTRVTDIRALDDLGIDLGPVSPETVTGTVTADVVYTERSAGDARLTVNADLAEADVEMPAFDWTKPAGTPGRLDLALDISNNLITMIPSFALTSPGLDVRGLATFAEDGTGLESIRLQRFDFGRTNVVGIVIPRDDGGWDVDFNGPSLDLSSVWSELTEESEVTLKSGVDTDPLVPDLTVSMRVDRVWLDETRHLDGLSGAFSREGGQWRSMFVESTGEEDTRFTLRMAPGLDGNRVLTMRAENAGAVLNALGLYDNMVGGRLELEGTFDDSVADPPLKGSLNVTDYRIVDLPWLARLVNVMALTGIADSLRGSGISFTSLELPFERTSETMVIRNGKAFGVSLGITVNGTMYLGADFLDLNGTIVPAYALNSVLGNVPLLGPLFTGGEEGGGVFAANYSVGGTREDPDVSVNPLSALAPGFLRNIFGVFDGTSDDDVGPLPDGPEGGK